MKIMIIKNTAVVMLGLAIAFFWFVLGHPEFRWPWNGAVTYGFYGLYSMVMTAMFFLTREKK